MIPCTLHDDSWAGKDIEHRICDKCKKEGFVELAIQYIQRPDGKIINLYREWLNRRITFSS